MNEIMITEKEYKEARNIVKQYKRQLRQTAVMCRFYSRIMTVDRQHTEIFDQAHQMWAEGTSIGEGEGLEPKEQDIQHLLGGEGWVADEIDIWFDDLQKFWRWSCKIERP